jgi:hypothetical protein
LFIFFVLINKEARKYLKDRKRRKKLKMKDVHDMISRNKEGNLSAEEDEDDEDEEDEDEDEAQADQKQAQQQHDDVFEKRPEALGESVHINNSNVNNYNSLGAVQHHFGQSLSERHQHYQANGDGYQKSASLRYTSSVRTGGDPEHQDFINGISAIFNKSMVSKIDTSYLTFYKNKT